MPRRKKYQCPCCGNFTLGARGEYLICPVCFWEDDWEGEAYGKMAPERPQGANRLHLWEARGNYLAFGACEEAGKENVRPPHPEELPERA